MHGLTPFIWTKHRIVQVGVDLITAERFQKLSRADEVESGDHPGLRVWRLKV
jgi:hypothetical protein